MSFQVFLCTPSTDLYFNSSITMCTLSDPRSCRLPNWGVWRCFQPKGVEGRASRRNGPMGWYPHCTSCSGTQPQDLHVCQGTSGVSSLCARSNKPALEWLVSSGYLNILIIWSYRANCYGMLCQTESGPKWRTLQTNINSKHSFISSHRQT